MFDGLAVGSRGGFVFSVFPMGFVFDVFSMVWFDGEPDRGVPL